MDRREPGRGSKGTGSETVTRRALLVLALSAAVVLVFARVRGFEFLTWDDNINVTENPHVLRPGFDGLATLWREPYAGLYVPVASTWFWCLTQLSRWASGTTSNATPLDASSLDPAWFHGGNLVLHALCAWLVFRIVARLVRDDVAAFAGALLVALHPLVVEPVAWISEARGLLGAALSFAALDLALSVASDSVREGAGASRATAARLGTRGIAWRLAAASLCFALALLAKPQAVALPLVLLALDRFVLRRPWRNALPLAGAWLAGSVAVIVVTKSAQTDDMLRFVTPLAQRPLVALDALGFYLLKLVAPVGLVTDYGRTPAWLLADLSRAWPALIPLVLAAALVAIRPARRYLPAFLVFVLALSPVLGLVPFLYQDVSTVGDRYVYPALVGVALAVAWAYASIAARFGRLAANVAAFAPTAALGVSSFAALPVWRDNTSLFTRVLEVNPRSFKAESNLALAAMRQMRWDEAIRRYRRALEVGPSRWIVHQNLGVALYQAGDKAACEVELAKSFALRRENTQVASMLGSVRLELGRYAEAVEPLRVATGLDPTNPVVAEWLGAALLLVSRSNEAVIELRRALTLRDTVGSRTNLAQALVETGDVRGAVEQYRALANSPQTTAEIELSLAWLLATAADDGVRDGAAALAIAERHARPNEPRTSRALDTLAAALACVGRHAEAEVRAREALAALSADDKQLAAAIEERRATYARGLPWRSPAPANAAVTPENAAPPTDK